MRAINENSERMSMASAAPAERILLWLGWADKDYLAARRLLLNAYLSQGAALANTAVEKYLKTLYMIIGRKAPRSHDIVALYESVLEDFGNLQELNVTFLKVLRNVYRLRYPDDLEVGFSVSLAQPKVLTELDRTVHHIRKGFAFRKVSGEPVESILDWMIKRNDTDLLDANCYFGSVQRVEVFEKLCNCFEMRVVEPDRILEAYYQARIADDGDLPLEGLRRQTP
jgi:HEPN domain-containing protein